MQAWTRCCRKFCDKLCIFDRTWAATNTCQLNKVNPPFFLFFWGTKRDPKTLMSSILVPTRMTKPAGVPAPAPAPAPATSYAASAALVLPAAATATTAATVLAGRGLLRCLLAVPGGRLVVVVAAAAPLPVILLRRGHNHRALAPVTAAKARRKLLHLLLKPLVVAPDLRP